jgi:hypothetical protein
MKNLVCKFLIFSAWLMLGASVSAQSLSLHQFPQSYAKSQFVDGSGQLVQQTLTYTGFKDQFAPTGTTGCTMGVSALRNECTLVTGGLSFGLPGAQQIKEFRLFVPAGTKRFVFGGYLPQNYEAAVVVRASRAPDRVNPLTEAEYANFRNQGVFNIFERIAAGEELTLVHAGGGGFSLAGNNTLAQPLEVGVWLYFRLINGEYVDTPRATYEIDLPMYIAGYNNIAFGGDGDPPTVAVPPPADGFSLSPTTLTQGSATSTSQIVPGAAINLASCQAVGVNAGYVSVSNGVVALNTGAQAIPSSSRVDVSIQCGSQTRTLTILANPNPPTTPLTSITLSQYSLLSNDTATAVTVVPNAGASLGSCKAMHPASDFTPATQSAYVIFSGNSFRLTDGAKAITDVKRELIITCGDNISSAQLFTIEVPPPPIVIRDSEENGSLTLTVEFKPTGVSATTTSSARIWTVLFVPENKSFGIKADQYYFLLGTSQLVVLDISAALPPLSPITLEKITTVKASQDVVIKTGFSIADLVAYKAQIHFYYQIGNEEVKYLGKVYPHPP